MNLFKKAWTFLQEQVTPSAQLTPAQVLERICALLTSLDEKLENLSTQLSQADHRMQIMHERQIAILDKLNFMVRQEEKELARIEHRIDEGKDWTHQGEEHNP